VFTCGDKMTLHKVLLYVKTDLATLSRVGFRLVSPAVDGPICPPSGVRGAARQQFFAGGGL